MDTISCKRTLTVPKLCHKYTASSGNDSLFLLNSSRAFSRVGSLLTIKSRTNSSILLVDDIPSCHQKLISVEERLVICASCLDRRSVMLLFYAQCIEAAIITVICSLGRWAHRAASAPPSAAPDVLSYVVLQTALIRHLIGEHRPATCTQVAQEALNAAGAILYIRPSHKKSHQAMTGNA